MKLLTANHVTYTYPNQSDAALKNVSFQIEQGTYTVIAGANASGKTTLAKILCSLISPDSGTVTYHSGVKKALVLQSPKNQIVCKFVSKDTSFGPEILKLNSSEVELRTIESLMLTGLLHKASSASNQLSQGEVQKEALSGMIALHPELLILDDSLSMLDPTSKEDVFRFIAYWVHKGNTVIHITNEQDALKQAQNIIALNAGKILFSGSKKDFFKTKTVVEKIIGNKIQKNKRAQKQEGNITFAMKDVSFSYNNESTLSNINFLLQEGTLTALTGISGSGKSTVLELGAALLIPESGNIFSVERPLLFEQNQSDVDNLSYGSSRLKEVKRFANVDFPVLFFDEPTCGLDAKSREAVLTLLRKLADKGKTVLFTTHTRDEVDFADREITMLNGAIINDTLSSDKKTNAKSSDLIIKEAKNFSEQKPVKEASHLSAIRKLSYKFNGSLKDEKPSVKNAFVLKLVSFVPFLIDEYYCATKNCILEKYFNNDAKSKLGILQEAFSRTKCRMKTFSTALKLRGLK